MQQTIWMKRFQWVFGIVWAVSLVGLVVATLTRPLAHELGPLGVVQVLVLTGLRAWMVLQGWRLLGQYAQGVYFSEEVAGLYGKLFKAQLLFIALGLVQLRRRGFEVEMSTVPWLVVAAFWTWGVVTRAGLSDAPVAVPLVAAAAEPAPQEPEAAPREFDAVGLIVELWWTPYALAFLACGLIFLTTWA